MRKHISLTTLKGGKPKTDTAAQYAHAFYLILRRLDGKGLAVSPKSQTKFGRNTSRNAQ